MAIGLVCASRSVYAGDECQPWRYRYDPAARAEPATFLERHVVRVVPRPAPTPERKPSAFREVPRPAVLAPKPTAGDEGEKISLTREDFEAANEAAANHGAEIGYTRGYSEGLAVAKGKVRVLTREEAIEIGLKAARKAMERRFGKQDP